MNILFYRYNSICEFDIIEAFKTLGHTVYTIDEEITNKKVSPSQAIQLVHRALSVRNYDFVFTINFYPVISEVCNIYHIPYLCWIVDSPVLELYSNSLCNSYNYIFLFDSALYHDFAPYNPNHIFYLPLACNVSMKHQIATQTDATLLEQFSHKVSFIGSLYSEKNPYIYLKHSSDYMKGYLDSILNAQLKTYGYYFIDDLMTDDIVTYFSSNLERYYKFPENCRADYKALVSQFYLGSQLTVLDRTQLFGRLSEMMDVDIYTFSDTSSMPLLHNHGSANSITEMPLIFHNTQINLNPTARSIRNGVSLRVWDILGCEGFLLTNYQNDLFLHFTPGVHLDYYASEEEFYEKVRYYAERPPLCREIAHQGFKYVRDNHTYLIRCDEMLRTVFG